MRADLPPVPLLALKRRGFRYVVLDEEGIFFAHAKRAPEPSDVLLFNNEYQRRLEPTAPGTDVVGNRACTRRACCRTCRAKCAGYGRLTVSSS